MQLQGNRKAWKRWKEANGLILQANESSHSGWGFTIRVAAHLRLKMRVLCKIECRSGHCCGCTEIWMPCTGDAEQWATISQSCAKCEGDQRDTSVSPSWIDEMTTQVVTFKKEERGLEMDANANANVQCACFQKVFFSNHLPHRPLTTSQQRTTSNFLQKCGVDTSYANARPEWSDTTQWCRISLQIAHSKNLQPIVK